ncbi:hypothetical protein [Pseudomonas savastanoi]|uniref:hypothetical protein n=1 Tax=Pseudomonas savastanoi TaxID=29438 RepID=UPI000F010084|nr:hypothetical protein [Pseudomonas savastanoi]
MIQCYASRSLLNAQRSTIFSKFCGLPVAEDISRNLTEITAIAVTNQDNVKRTQNASHELKGLSAGLNDVISRLSA